MKKVNKYQLLVIIFFAIVGIVIVILTNCNSQAVKIAFTEPKATQEDYDILKEYAIDISKGNSFENENLKVDKKIEGQTLKIKLESKKMYGIEATFPIIFEEKLDLENNLVKFEGTIDYDNATYIEYTEVKSRFGYILIDLFIISLWVLLGYVICWGLKEYKRINEKN